MPRPAAAGEIWRVDLGLTAKVRPCLAMSDYPAEDELGPEPRVTLIQVGR